MSVQIEALFTSALGLQAPWEVQDVRLDTAKRAIAYLRLSKLTHLPASPFLPALAPSEGITTHRM